MANFATTRTLYEMAIALREIKHKALPDSDPGKVGLSHQINDYQEKLINLKGEYTNTIRQVHQLMAEIAIIVEPDVAMKVHEALRSYLSIEGTGSSKDFAEAINILTIALRQDLET